MSVLATAGKVVGGAVVGAGIALAVTWGGQANLEAVQEKAESYVIKVEEMKANYEAILEDKQHQIDGVKDMYDEASKKVAELEKAKGELETVLEELNAGYVYSLAQNKKYEDELKKANADAEAHEQVMDEILDESIFESKGE